MRPGTVVSLLALMAMTVVGVVYLTVGVLDMNPTRSTNRVVVHMDTSGGLMDTSQVTSRGIHVGRVESIAVVPGGLDVTLALDADHRIPADSEVVVANLSAAGEQYLDLRPRGTGGPDLADGDEIGNEQVRASITVSEALSLGDSLAAQLDTNAVKGLTETASAAIDGREGDVDRLVEAFRYLSATLRDKSGEIRRLYDNAQQGGRNAYGYGPVMTDAAPWVGATGSGVANLLEGFNDYSYVGADVWDDPLGKIGPKIDQYLTPLSPDLALIATLLKPYTAPIKPMRVDAGSIVDMLQAVFPPGGPAELSVQIPN
ncbi:MlaD family protein [Rhodococcus cercidiphylli]|uniref:MlaD family protein n=1 Tax=Rhodococcus cercidiphylli TaxID=489916 RepID=A0ABU4AXU2_9NOCA|nr:MlaD family protein [Rhodococcus cercidiphylli]MDV6231052.1 MlaD family protein [Rhodococcus cercidiphylli]